MNIRRKRQPGDPEGREMILSEEAPWPVREAYKALRTNLVFSLPGKGGKVIGVTSSIQHEGKTLSAVNTALTFGDLGKKVLLMECDLRMPRVGQMLGFTSIPGLSDCLVGQASLEDALKRKVRNRLDVLPSGNIPPDPTWLLQSDQMKVLVEGFRNMYDYVFIDLPPVLAVADASIVARLTDGYIVVVRDQVSSYPEISETLSQLQFAGAKVLGFVYNDKHRETGRYYSRYYK